VFEQCFFNRERDENYLRAGVELPENWREATLLFIADPDFFETELASLHLTNPDFLDRSGSVLHQLFACGHAIRSTCGDSSQVTRGLNRSGFSLGGGRTNERLWTKPPFVFLDDIYNRCRIRFLGISRSFIF